jgi:pimeloyl-ACP methyl ester carboxylesterase
LDKTNHDGGRRALLKSLGVAGASTVAAAMLPLSRAGAAEAVSASTSGSSDGNQPVYAEEYWANKNGVKLWVYRKNTTPNGAPKAVLFLVHGSSYSAKTMYDLQVPNRINYSMMDYFARLGFDVWTMDHEGYGHSDRTASFSDIASGAEDLKAAMLIVTKVTGQRQAAFFGQSSGSLRAAAFTMANPEQVSSLTLDAFVYTGRGSPELAKRRKMLPSLLKSNVRKVDAAFYSSVFTRDEVGAAEPMISDMVTEAELKYGNTVPNGTYVDMVTKLPVADPTKITCPVLIVRGQSDGIAVDADLIDFYSQLPNPDKQMVKLAGLAHTAMLGVNRERFLWAVQAFLTLPPYIDIGGPKDRPAKA